MDKGHREALREAARKLVREKGLSRTTARDLVGESGTNLRSIGYHFGGKDELMTEVLSLITAEWTAGPVAASRAPAEGALPEQRMTSAVRTMLTGLPAKLDDLFVYLEGITEARHSPRLATDLARVQEESFASIAAAITEGAPDLPDGVPRLLARLLVAVHDGLALQLTVAPAPELEDVDAVVVALAGLGITLGAGVELPGAAALLRSLIEPAEEEPVRPPARRPRRR